VLPAEAMRVGPVSLTELSSVLWRTRELLELLLFKLEEEQLLLAAGRSRWLAHATREVEMVLEQIRKLEVVRAVYAQAAATELNLEPDASLGQLADAAPMPWFELLHQHRKAFVTLTAEISGLADANRELLTAGQRAVRETMLVVAGSVDTYGPKGQTVSGARRSRLVDEAI
jgi:FlgN protein